VNRIDLFVAPEDYLQVKALGASWDRQAKCWFIEAQTPDARFAAWLPTPSAGGDEERDGLVIESSEAFVARARINCRRCRRSIDVVCLYCRQGTVAGEPLQGFRVQCLWATDDALRRQLQRWPAYRMDDREGIYLNHCPHCGARQDESDLHEEPGQPFHDLCRAVPEGVELLALEGRVRLSGDYSAEV
jgi:hypothetical protein